MKILSSLILSVLFIAYSFSQPDFAAIIEGPLLIEDTPGHIIMKSAEGSYWTLIVDGLGQLNTKAASFSTIDVTLSNGQTYTNNLSVGDEEAVSILQQAKQYLKSTIVMDASTNWQRQYQYTPINHFTGSDQVTLLVETGSDGASPNTNFEYLTIRFTVND